MNAQELIDLVVAAVNLDPNASSLDEAERKRRKAQAKVDALTGVEAEVARGLTVDVSGGNPPSAGDVATRLRAAQSVADEREAQASRVVGDGKTAQQTAVADAVKAGALNPQDPAAADVFAAVDLDVNNPDDLDFILGGFSTQTMTTGQVVTSITDTPHAPGRGGILEGEQGDLSPQTAAVEQVYGEINRLQGQALRDKQMKLYRAGFYGDNVRFDSIKWGDQDDPATKAAWRAAVDAASSRFQGGFLITTDQLLDSRISGGLGPDESDGAGGEPVSLSNPQTLSSQLDKVAASTLGRRANESEKRMFVELVHRMEQQYANELAKVRDAGGGVVEAPDATVAAEGLLREQAPEQAQQMDVAGSYRNFLGMIGAGGMGAA